MKRKHASQRGTVYIEALIASAVLAVLLIAAGSAVLTFTKIQAANAGAVKLNITAATLAQRLAAEKMTGTREGAVVAAGDGLRFEDAPVKTGGKGPWLPGPTEEQGRGMRFRYRATEIPLQNGKHYVSICIHDGKAYVSAGAFYVTE